MSEKKEVNLEPVSPVRTSEWVLFPAPQEVIDLAHGLPVECYLHENTRLTVISLIEMNPATECLEYILMISRDGWRQASEREVNFVLTNFRATDFKVRDRRGAIKVFAKQLETNGKPVHVRMVH